MTMPAPLPELDAAPPLTPEEKKERQRLHVRRSYYRKLNRMNEMREQVCVLKEQYALALKQRATTETSLAQSPAQTSAVELYAQISRVKEQLLEENAALEQLLADQNALGFKINQLQLEFQSEQKKFLDAKAVDASKEPYYLRVPMTVAECHQLAWNSYMQVLQFMQGDRFLSTGATAFGWRDRRRIEGDRLKFSLKKKFTHMSPYLVTRRSWDVLTSGEKHATLYSSSLRVNIYIPQVVDENNFVAHRVFSTPGGKVVAKSLYLVSLFQVETGFVVIYRAIDKSRLGKKYEGSFEDPKLQHKEPQEHWLEDVFTWSIHEEAGNDCTVDFGGDIPGTLDYGQEVWMLEVLLIVLRWESKVVGSLFTITSS